MAHAKKECLFPRNMTRLLKVNHSSCCEKFHAELFSFLIIYMDLLMGERIADDKSSHVVCGLFE